MSKVGRPPTCDCGECEKCKHREYMRQWYAEHPGYAAESVRRRWQREPEVLRAYEAKKYAENPERKLANNERWRSKNPEKTRAHIAVHNAVARGKLAKQPCEVCGEVEVDGHHDDYTKPLEVRWLCRLHHCEHHRLEEAA